MRRLSRLHGPVISPLIPRHELLDRLATLALEPDRERAQNEAEKLLLCYIGDPVISAVYKSLAAPDPLARPAAAAAFQCHGGRVAPLRRTTDCLKGGARWHQAKRSTAGTASGACRLRS